MSEFFNIILKYIVIGIIVVTALLPLLSSLFNLFATFFLAIPVFARVYAQIGLGALVLKVVVGWFKSE